MEKLVDGEVQWEVDEVAHDIFEWFPILVCQNIFKHLDGKAVIQASGVNKEWNKLCTESQQVEKLKIVFNPDGDEEKKLRKIRAAVTVLQKSKRQYKNIEFRKTSSAVARFVFPFLADGKGSWKSLKLQECRIDHQMLLEMMRVIEPSVEELFIDDFNLSGQIRDDLNWHFPCLKNLEVGAWQSNIFHRFARCTNLITFHCQFWGGGNLFENLRTLLRNNHKLEDLDIRTDVTLFDHPSEFRFKLKKFKTGLSDDTAPEIIQSFLETQAQTLETLDVDGGELNQASLELILGMPRLTSLNVSVSDIEDAISNWNQVPVNTTITSLKLDNPSLELNLNADLTTPFETFIRALQNLKHFKCDVINDEVLLLLARAAPALESLKTRWFNVTRFQEGDVFPNITKFKAGGFRYDIQEPTGDSHFAALVREGMRENHRRY